MFNNVYKNLSEKFMADAIVARTLGMDFIYLDLIFLVIWTIMMIRKRYTTALQWGLVGGVTYIITDYILWYLILKVRHYSGPLDPFVFFMWFCISPGYIQFSYVFIMFEKRNLKEMVFWTLLFYIGWTCVGCGSQLFHWDDRVIMIYRDMNQSNQRMGESIMVAVNIVISILLLVKKKARIEDILFMYLVGTLVEFALEFTLAVSGIRQQQGTWSFELMIINTLIEFNLGIVIMYLIYHPLRMKRYPGVGKPMSWRDLRHIKTDFNFVSKLFDIKSKEELNPKTLADILSLYTPEAIKSDIKYLQEKYQIPLITPECIGTLFN